MSYAPASQAALRSALAQLDAALAEGQPLFLRDGRHAGVAAAKAIIDVLEPGALDGLSLLRDMAPPVGRIIGREINAGAAPNDPAAEPLTPVLRELAEAVRARLAS